MTLGERIRSLRKERKMTLQQLAGDAITKGMLSLIENNKAKPSMESLQHIASMLQVSVSDLLDTPSEDHKELVKEMELLYTPSNFPNQENMQKIVDAITPHLDRLKKGYIDARLLDLFSRAAYELNQSNWEDYANHAIRLYEENHISRRAASLKLFKVLTIFFKKNYHEALDSLLYERKLLDDNTLWNDPLSRLDYDYTEAIFYYAVGEKDKALETMHQAIEFSRSQKIFYRLDQLYRLAAIHAIMANDKKEAQIYIDRIEGYANFADDKEAMGFTCYLWIHYYTSYEQNIPKAQELLEKVLETKTSDDDSEYENIETAKIAYFEGESEKAKHLLENTTVPSYISHPIDLSIFSERDYYLAKIYMEDGNITQALALVEQSWELLKDFPETPYQLRMKELRDQLTK